MRCSFFALALTSIMIGLAACSEGKKPAPPSTHYYYVQGNPYDIFKGSNFSKKVNINEPTATFFFEEDVDEEGRHYKFRSDDSPIWMRLNLSFDGKLYFPRGDDQFEVLHFSITPDKKYFSILFKSFFKGNVRYVSSLTFSLASFNHKAFTAEPTLKKYNYLRGAGLPLKWDQPVTLNICHNGPKLSHLITATQKAADKWNEALGFKQVHVKHLEFYPPLSDLNTQCIYLNETFFSYEAAGAAYSSFRIESRSLLDSDIFIWGAHYKKDKDSVFDDPRVFSHEIGHLLGLAHQFAYSEHKSVMGYNHKISTPKAYDKEAIRALYSH